ncbi:MAG: 2TM domain-containing protein [Burkholderiaceae bacterium]
MSRRHDAFDPRRAARRAADRKLGFFIHLTVFVLVNAGLVVLNLATGRFAWSAFPLLGWGLGLAIHGLVALGPIEQLRKSLIAREEARISSEQ